MKEIILYQSFPKTTETKNWKGLAVLTQGARYSHPGFVIRKQSQQDRNDGGACTRSYGE